MAAMAPDGAVQAINLTGLTLQGEMDMALRIGQYRSPFFPRCLGPLPLPCAASAILEYLLLCLVLCQPLHHCCSPHPLHQLF